MNPNRKRKSDPPQPGGESFQIGEAGPVTYHYPMPPVKSRGQLRPADEWQVGEAAPPQPATAQQEVGTRAEAVDPRTRHTDPGDPTSALREFLDSVVTAARSTLDREQLQVLDLVLRGERTIADVADALEVPRTTAHARYKAALANLRRILDHLEARK